MPNLFEHLHGLDERPHMRKEWGRGPMESECVERCGSVKDAEQRVFYSRKEEKPCKCRTCSSICMALTRCLFIYLNILKLYRLTIY